MKNKLRNSGGITLIALIVTIVVLLILAGVTIATLTGENRYFGTSPKGPNKYKSSKIHR